MGVGQGRGTKQHGAAATHRQQRGVVEERRCDLVPVPRRRALLHRQRAVLLHAGVPLGVVVVLLPVIVAGIVAASDGQVRSVRLDEAAKQLRDRCRLLAGREVLHVHEGGAEDLAAGRAVAVPVGAGVAVAARQVGCRRRVRVVQRMMWSTWGGVLGLGRAGRRDSPSVKPGLFWHSSSQVASEASEEITPGCGSRQAIHDEAHGRTTGPWSASFGCPAC